MDHDLLRPYCIECSCHHIVGGHVWTDFRCWEPGGGEDEEHHEVVREQTAQKAAKKLALKRDDDFHLVNDGEYVIHVRGRDDELTIWKITAEEVTDIRYHVEQVENVEQA